MSGKTYTPVTFKGFGGGLNIRDKPDVVDEAQAIDCLNVMFTERGAVGQRPGFAKLTTGLTNKVDSLHPYYTTTGIRHLLAGCGTRLEALSTAGAVVASATGLAGGPWTFARVGTPNAERAYAGNGQDLLQRWDGSAWSAPAGGPKAGALAVTGNDNRLVAAGFGGTTGGPSGAASSPSHLFFSTAGDPEGWAASNFIQLRPGDGEKVVALASWKGDVYAFKESSFFVFYGTSTDSTGGAVFNYRPVQASVGCVGPQAVAVGSDGVYFMSRRGVYRTTGGTPELLSDLIGPLFTGDLDVLFTGSQAINHAAITGASVTWHDEKVYVSVPTGTSTTNDRVLVYDTRYQWWSILDLKVSDATPFRVGDSADLVFGYSSGTKDVGRVNGSYTSDDGVAITSRWRSGWQDFGTPDVKTVRESKLWGTGTVRFAVAKDFTFPVHSDEVVFPSDIDLWGDGLGTDLWAGGADSDTWGPSSSIAPQMVRWAHRGTVFSTSFENNVLDQTWRVHRLAHHLRSRRIPSVVRTEVAA